MMSDNDHGKSTDDAIAVALAHKPGSATPPRIAASGHGPVARQILQIALDNGVKVREDSDLAAILAAIEVDSVIPLEAFAAVAEILTYLYRANGVGYEEERNVVGAHLWHSATPEDTVTQRDNSTPGGNPDGGPGGDLEGSDLEDGPGDNP